MLQLVPTLVAPVHQRKRNGGSFASAVSTKSRDGIVTIRDGTAAGNWRFV
jgi:hypothetical protein